MGANRYLYTVKKNKRGTYDVWAWEDNKGGASVADTWDKKWEATLSAKFLRDARRRRR